MLVIGLVTALMAGAPPPLAAASGLVPSGALQLSEPRLGAGAPVDRSGRAELVLFQTLYGIYSGIGIAVAADTGPRPAAALALAGGAVGLAASLIATSAGSLSTARASAIDSAGGWGALNGSLIGVVADASGRASVGAGVAAGAVAIVAAAIATGYGEVTAGDVALVNSGGVFGVAAAALSLTFLHDPSARGITALLLAGADAGLLAMAVTAPWVEISRGHVLLIDAAGAVGTALGLAIPFIAGARDAAAYGAGGLAGMAAGLAVGAVAFRHWEEEGETRGSAAGGRTVPVILPLAAGGLAAGLAGQF